MGIYIYILYIYLHEWLILLVNVGIYKQYMDPMGSKQGDLSLDDFQDIFGVESNGFRMDSAGK